MFPTIFLVPMHWKCYKKPTETLLKTLWKKFSSIDEIKENATKELKAIPSSDYEKCMDEWVKRWHMCIASDGCYFEGDKINVPEN